MKRTRRRFLESTLRLPIAAALGDGLARQLELLPQARAQEPFENPHLIKYDANCFTLHRQDRFIFSAALHYPRCPKPLWRDRLEKLQRAGFNTIETPVFWNYHEREEGKCDLSEFEEFVARVKNLGLWMIARPGPYIGADWHRGGIPDWVVAKGFPLRSNHPENLRWSHHWFRQILPVILRHQITTGGPIILLQIENEYDYWNFPPAGKRAYLSALAQMVWGAGIDIPILTCSTRQARENADPVMARLTDTCSFYPRWNIAPEVPPALAQLRQEEPKAPLGVTELQGGWSSEFGGALAVRQEGVSAAQFEVLTKTVVEQGVTYLNVSMGAGGTNFDGAGQRLTTTYDYAAPLREPGGLWDKYYAARSVGASLELLGGVLARAERLEGIPQSTNPNISVTERVSGKSGVVFVRENANAEQRFKMYFQDPYSPTKRIIAAPREGELTIGPREMKLLPVGLPIPGSRLRYSTGEVLAAGLILDRHYVLIYDAPGRLVEVGLSTRDQPQVEGDYTYNYHDPEYESVVIGVHVGEREKIVLVNQHLLVVFLPRARALRSWTAEFPPSVVPGAEEPKPIVAPFIADSYLWAASGSDGKRLWAEFEFQPGEHELIALLPPQPSKCRVDGVLTSVEYERPMRTARLKLSTPSLPYAPLPLTQVQTWVERIDTQRGEWHSGALAPLEQSGPLPYGYVKYRAQFAFEGQEKMFLSSFSEDARKVFLNGALVAEASSSKNSAEFPLTRYAQQGSNTLDIVYEIFGAPHFGAGISALKGLASVRVGGDAATAPALETWQIQRVSPVLRGREIDPQVAQKAPKEWQPAALGLVPASPELVPAFTWCRAEFILPAPVAGWSVPWKLILEAERDALLYLNGRFLGRYATVGPQKEFYLPQPYLAGGAKPVNVLMIQLAYADQPNAIRVLRVAPYEEFASRRTRVEFEW